jgi:chromosome segregation ATPase
MKKNNNNINNYKTCTCKNEKYDGPQQSYSYYSRVLSKPFDSVEELVAAERAYEAEQRAKEDKVAARKADAAEVEAAFKALNAARKEYKKDLAEVTDWYREELTKLKESFNHHTSEIKKKLAAAEAAYETALREFNKKYPEGFHLTLKDGDFETTINSKITSNSSFYDIFDIFNSIFNN